MHRKCTDGGCKYAELILTSTRLLKNIFVSNSKATGRAGGRAGGRGGAVRHLAAGHRGVAAARAVVLGAGALRGFFFGVCLCVCFFFGGGLHVVSRVRVLLLLFFVCFRACFVLPALPEQRSVGEQPNQGETSDTLPGNRCGRPTLIAESRGGGERSRGYEHSNVPRRNRRWNRPSSSSTIVMAGSVRASPRRPRLFASFRCEISLSSVLLLPVCFYSRACFTTRFLLFSACLFSLLTRFYSRVFTTRFFS